MLACACARACMRACVRVRVHPLAPPMPFSVRAPGQPKMDHLRRLHLGAYPTEACKACTR